MATPDDPTPTPAWDPNPLVVVSRRNRNFLFPAAVLLRDPTPEDLLRWYGPKADPAERAEQTVTVLAGITFLGAMTTCWKLKDIRNASEAPQDAKGRPVPPSYDSCLLVNPENSTRNSFDLPQFRDRATRAILGPKVHEAWKRVFAFLKTRDEEQTKQGQLGLWATAGGYDAPEMMLMPLRDALEHRTDLGQQAYGITLAAIPWVRNATHLGALHDHACHHAQAWPLVEAARKRIAAWRQADPT